LADIFKDFNGVTEILENKWLSGDKLHLFTDAAGSDMLGAGCFLEKEWCFLAWPRLKKSHSVMKDITFLEMVSIVLAIHISGNK
jgi:hypothetical protein